MTFAGRSRETVPLDAGETEIAIEVTCKTGGDACVDYSSEAVV